MRNGDYELIVAPPVWEGRRYRGRYCYEHHYVWWKHTGQYVGDGFCIHHKNGNKRDNEFSNLELLSNVTHASRHGSTQDKSYVRLRCPNPRCRIHFIRPRNLTHLVRGGVSTSCSRKCSGAVSHLVRRKDPRLQELLKENVLEVFLRNGIDEHVEG